MRLIIKYITETLVVFALVINSIQFLLFSLAGIDYDPEEGTGLVAILNVSFCLYSIAWVIYHELFNKPVHHEFWPYFLPFLFIAIFYFDCLLFGKISYSSLAGRMFVFFGTNAIPAIYIATYTYRHERFDMITRASDVIMFICTLSLIINIPNMFDGIYGEAVIGGSGGHQEISYSAAFCFGMNWVNLLSGNKCNRFEICKSSVYKYLCIVLLPIQAVICILGTGRGGAVLLLVVFIVGILIYSRRNLIRTIFWSALILMSFFLIAKYTSFLDGGFGRSFDFIRGGMIVMEADAERSNIYSHAHDLIRRSPIFGYGLWHGLSMSEVYLHNVFYDVLVAGGVIYFLIFVRYIIKSYKSAYRLFEDPKFCMLLPWILYPSVMLMFSGLYLTNPLFWFCFLYSFLSRNKLSQN